MKKLQKALLTSKLTVACAESCTGGLVAKLLTDLPGSSRVFKGGLVTYCDEMKEALLGVKAETLRAYRAVSRQTAEEMAAGALEKTGADLAVSTTGVAGPSGDDSGKPVGTVYIGLAVRTAEGILVSAGEYHFSGSRDAVRRKAAREALRLLAEKSLPQG